MRKLLIAAAVLLALVFVLSLRQHAAVETGPGVLAAEVPQQVDLGHGAVLQRDGVSLQTRAHFDITARVLSRKDYSSASDGDLVPVDLALGWGRMSDSAVLDKIEISQSGRFYFWRVSEFPIPENEIIESSANMHLIPADATIQREIERTRVGDVVTFDGYLVEADGPNGYKWVSSLSRTDSGAGACELVWVEHFDIAPRH